MIKFLLAKPIIFGLASGAVLALIAGWFLFLQDKLEKADKYENVMIELQKKDAIIEDQAKDFERVQRDKAATDERREHWRQGKVRKEYEQYKQATKDWIHGRYPDELDGLSD